MNRRHATHPIRISMHGDGSLVHVHPHNARRLFATFQRINSWTHSERSRRATPYQRNHPNAPPLLETLLRTPYQTPKAPLTLAIVNAVRSIINHQTIHNAARLNPHDLTFSTGYHTPKNAHHKAVPSKVYIQYGTVFHIVPISLQRLLYTTSPVDLFLEDVEHNVHFLRFQGTHTHRGHIALNMAMRLHLSHTRLIPLRDFTAHCARQFRSLYTIQHAHPLEGITLHPKPKFLRAE